MQATTVFMAADPGLLEAAAFGTCEDAWAAILARPHLNVGGLPLSGGEPVDAMSGADRDADVDFTTDLDGTRIGGERAGTGEEGRLKPLTGRIRRWLEEGYRVVFVCTGPESRERIARLLEQ